MRGRLGNVLQSPLDSPPDNAVTARVLGLALDLCGALMIDSACEAVSTFSKWQVRVADSARFRRG